MRAVLDACVVYPTVMREMLMGVAKAGLFEPVWSSRILEEWSRAARKLGPEGEVQARAEVALLRSQWPDAEQGWPPSLEARLWLPDPADIHVLALAIASSADVIVTLNSKDFPRNILAEEGLERDDADLFLLGFWQSDPAAAEAAAERVLTEARRLSGQEWDIRRLMKKARLPRLGKALAA